MPLGSIPSAFSLAGNRNAPGTFVRTVEAQCRATTLRTRNADGGPAGPDAL